MECVHEKIEVDEDTHARVCVTCGLVISESELVESGIYEPASKRIFIDKDYFWEQLKLIDSLCQRFSFGESIASQAKTFFSQLHQRDRSLVSLQKKGKIAAGISVFMTNRKAAVPAALSLADIAGALNEPVTSLGHYLALLKKVAPELAVNASSSDDKVLFIERYYLETVVPLLERNKVIIDDERKILSLAKHICRLSSLAWLDIGRKPEPFAMACLFLSLDSILNAGKTRRMTKGKLFDRNNKLEICGHYVIPYRTVQARVEEIFQFFLRESEGLLPWPVDKSNLLSYLTEIVKVLDKLHVNLADETVPPAFIASARNRQQMTERIEFVRKRMQSLEVTELADEMDQVIERLLGKNVSEDEIAGCNSLKQLCDLLSVHEPIHETEDDQE